MHTIETLTDQKIEDLLDQIIFGNEKGTLKYYLNKKAFHLGKIYKKEINEEENEELGFSKNEIVFVIIFEDLPNEMYAASVASRNYLHYIDGKLCEDEIEIKPMLEPYDYLTTIYYPTY